MYLYSFADIKNCFLYCNPEFSGLKDTNPAQVCRVTCVLRECERKRRNVVLCEFMWSEHVFFFITKSISNSLGLGICEIARF